MSVHFLRDVLNCELHAISVDPTKPFPREAEPRPEVLDDLDVAARLAIGMALQRLHPLDDGALPGASDQDVGDRRAVRHEPGQLIRLAQPWRGPDDR